MSTSKKETLGLGLLMAVHALTELNIFWEFYLQASKSAHKCSAPSYKWEKPPEKCRTFLSSHDSHNCLICRWFPQFLALILPSRQLNAFVALLMYNSSSLHCKERRLFLAYMQSTVISELLWQRTSRKKNVWSEEEQKGKKRPPE